MNNENINTNINKNGYALDKESVNLFWLNINNDITNATKESKYDPIKYLEYNDNKYFMKAVNLITWLKMAYPKSAIQTEKVICDNTKCQYQCKIWLDPANVSIPTSCEGKLIRVDETSIFTNQDNYISTAQTVAIVKCMQYLGFALHINDDYYVELHKKDNKNQNPSKQPVKEIVINSIDEARKCPIMYVQGYNGERTYDNRLLGEVEWIDKRFFRSILTKKCIDEYTKKCVKYILNHKE